MIPCLTTGFSFRSFSFNFFTNSLYLLSVYSLSVSTALDFTQKHHLAVVKTGSRVQIFVDGSPAAEGTLLDELMPDLQGALFTFGRYSFAGQSGFAGWSGALDELRISGSARYNAAFTPAAQAFEVDRHTLFLHHGEGLGQKAGVDFTMNG